MNEVLGSIIPFAVGIAISPAPVIAAIVMLLSPKARSISVALLCGWVLGIAAAITVFSLIAGALPSQDQDASHPVQGVIQLILGALLLIFSVRHFRQRTASKSSPKWMASMDSMSAGGALGLGLLLSAVNPKNLVMAANAGLDVGDSSLSVGLSAVAIVIFTVVAASTMLVPVVGYLVASQRLREPLDRLREWLVKENDIIVGVLLIVLGISLLGKGIASF